ncbi:UDP-N-acetylglucosamine--undecaprenyl-phosphate N-acetylglucosaminephosphotransferase [Aeromonas veronii]
MNSNILFFFIFIGAASFLLSLFFSKLAHILGLVDKPTQRKQHIGNVPLVGGLSIYTSVMLALWWKQELLVHSDIYVLCASILVMIGVIDDKYDIDYRIRLIVQIIVSCLMIFGAGLSLKSLGYILFGSELVLGPLGYIVTILAVLGAINAFNMVDGIDGLLGTLSLVAFSGLFYIHYEDEQFNLAWFSLLFIIVTVPYLLLNLGFILKDRCKIFMGDAGSMLFGFTIVWILLQGTQGATSQMKPVTALWLIAIPLIDMISTMVRRIKKKQSPFKADREHLHHICLRAGLSSGKSLALISFMAALLAIFGIFMEYSGIPDFMVMIMFLFISMFYYVMLSHIWKIISWLRSRS